MIGGSVICTVLLFVAAGLGTNATLSQSQQNMILASFILLPAFTRISASNTAFLTGAEIGGIRMRQKTMVRSFTFPLYAAFCNQLLIRTKQAFGTACDVLAAFLVTFVTPYLLPDMGVNIGWIFGSVALFSVIWSAIFFPELKVSTLVTIILLLFPPNFLVLSFFPPLIIADYVRCTEPIPGRSRRVV